MSRRYHSKSRHGCTQCKRRHIKCDEGKPFCVNCTTSRLECVYGAVPLGASTLARSPKPSLPHGNVDGTMDADAPVTFGFGDSAPSSASSNFASNLSMSPTASTPATSTTPSISGTPVPLPRDGPVNMHHMELLSHFILETSKMLGPSHEPATRVSLAITLSTPYLINQVLALSALHLSHIYRDQARRYAEEAATFQAASLSSLVSSTVSINKENCVPMLLFSALLGIYTLADAVINSDGNDFNFLDKYISYLDVHRGTNAVVAPFWDHLRQTELSPFLNTAAHQDLSLNDTAAGEIEEITSRLQNLLSSADMGEVSLTACRDAVGHLRWVLASISLAQAANQHATVDTIYSWPILLSRTFTGLLSKRRPEALIILAHYAVVLHERREIWVVGDSGKWLVEAITKMLGSGWREWLVWPNESLGRSRGAGSTLFLGAA